MKRRIETLQSRAIRRQGGFSALVASGLILALGTAAAQTTGVAPVPFVGCAADGQMGPVPAPKRIRAIPSVPGSVASRLAYYATEHHGVLAPRGWHCIGIYGSSGSTLLVTPERHNADDLFQQDAGLSGPVVELSYLSGGTSGRFDVAKIAARIFPVARSFVDQVIAEDIEPKEDFPFGPYPDDTLARRTATVVEFVTPANRDGIGTSGRLAKTDQPISGVAMIFPQEDMDVVKVSVRLPPEHGDLASTIVATVERNRGNPGTVR